MPGDGYRESGGHRADPDIRKVPGCITAELERHLVRRCERCRWCPMDSTSDPKRDPARAGLGTAPLSCPHCGAQGCESLRVGAGEVTMHCTACEHVWTIAERRAVFRGSDAAKVL